MPPRHSPTLLAGLQPLQNIWSTSKYFFPDCPVQLALPEPSLFKPWPPAQWDPQVSLGLTRKSHLVPGASKPSSHLAHPVPSPPPLSVPAICPFIPRHLCGCLFRHPHSRKMGFLNWRVDQPGSAVLALSPLSSLSSSLPDSTPCPGCTLHPDNCSPPLHLADSHPICKLQAQ